MTTLTAPTATAPDRLEDWRILAVLGLYRLSIVAALLSLYSSGYAPDFFRPLPAQWFYYGCLGYALAALVLLLLGVYRTPGLRIQAHLQLATDCITIGALLTGTGGVGGGMGILLVPPVVGCSLVLSPRMAAVHASIATLAVFAAETIHQFYAPTWDSSDMSQAGLLGLMFFVSGLVANTVAQRARRSEAMVERVGSQFVNLSRLSENIIETMQTGVLVIDSDGLIRVSNLAAQRLTGLPLSAGQSLEAQLPRLAEALQLWRRGLDDQASPALVGMHDHEILPRFTQLGWGQQAQVLILIEDAALLRQQAQQMKLASLGRLSAGIAHEIRNPLSAITQASQLLTESSTLEAQDRHLLAMILRHAGRIDRIVRDVLDLSRRDPGGRTALPLGKTLQRIIQLYRESHPHQVRPIQMSDDMDELQVMFDPDHLQQVLFNLWDNSFAHGGGGARPVHVSLQASVEDDAVQLCVADDGVGIPQSLNDRVFEPFFTTAASGTGLGLYLCRELCEYNGARLSYVHRSTGGACFCIRFGANRAGAISA
ncbi:PAS domain-containing protein [Sinimarinibacterium sp. CAU 1509]|uniref:sensor histidine kinase n=1 Tax=Sinimarinibacterium sp. CAU 1509 TaxID=2562283 RepID=UPI0010AB9715|nr:ATP-binding protein [Sinimarinibacterium sp. CAU 1509]TJY63026.1 PAS domain-containing protein [Sinimarinibacterium sp. CAU 1509]